MSRPRVWRWPIVLAVLTLLGLLSALLGEGGMWWAMSWIALAAPPLTILLCVLRVARRADQPAKSQPGKCP